MLLFIWALFISHLFLPARWVKKNVAKNLALGVSDPDALKKAAVKDTMLRSFIGYGAVLTVCVLGSADSYVAKTNITAIVMTWLIGYPFMWIACRSNIRKALRQIPPSPPILSA